MPNVAVMIAHSIDIDLPCAGAAKVAVSDTDGSFYVEEIRENRLFVSAINKPSSIMQINNLCFDVNGVPIFGQQLITQQLHSENIKLACDISRIPIKTPAVSVGAICKFNSSLNTDMQQKTAALRQVLRAG